MKAAILTLLQQFWLVTFM